MSAIALPTKVELKPGQDATKAQLVVEPCFPGYGVTLGNALRRILLSSLPGAAVTSVKIKGVSHEFSTIPHVKEDIIEILLNVKQIRFKLFREEPVQVTLRAHGEREIHAGDIDPSADLEVVNSKLLLATLTDKEAKLEIEFTVEPGYGYVPIEARDKKKTDIGVINVDAIYTPVRTVGFQIEPVRVGQMTNYERLILNIETDGTISPAEAITRSSQILLDHFQLFRGISLPSSDSQRTEMTVEGKEQERGEEGVEPKEESVALPTASAGEAGNAPLEEEPKKKRGRQKKSKE